MAVATTLTIEAADEVVSMLLDQHPELVGLEGCEEFENSITYTFESGHWVEVLQGSHGLTHLLHQPGEE